MFGQRLTGHAKKDQEGRAGEAEPRQAECPKRGPWPTSPTSLNPARGSRSPAHTFEGSGNAPNTHLNFILKRGKSIFSIQLPHLASLSLLVPLPKPAWQNEPAQFPGRRYSHTPSESYLAKFLTRRHTLPNLTQSSQ